MTKVREKRNGAGAVNTMSGEADSEWSYTPVPTLSKCIFFRCRQTGSEIATFFAIVVSKYYVWGTAAFQKTDFPRYIIETGEA